VSASKKKSLEVVVVIAHPKKESLSYGLLQAFLKGLPTHHKATVIDLYKDKFDPILRTVQRSETLDPEVEHYQGLLKKADWIIYIFPIWWFRTPSILEGFFDKVMTAGFAFKYRQITRTFGVPVPLLNKNTIVIETYGSPRWATKLFFLDLPWRRLKRGVLKFFGYGKLIRYSCFSAPYASEKKRAKWLKEVENS
jgi:NAD(P)H dehydrogenase (quinone)